MTRSSGAGKRTSAAEHADVEILSVSPHGVWLMAEGTEYLLGYDDYPWFRDATVGEIFDVRLLHGQHLWWPSLDVDLHLESLTHPERFPLVARGVRRTGRKRSR
jgi:hypothetical protein